MQEGSEDDPEKVHFNEVVASMRHYYLFFRKTLVGRMRRHHEKLTPDQLEMLPGGAAGVATKLATYDKCLRANQLFFDRVLLHMGQAPSALTIDFDPSSVSPPPFALGSWLVPSHHADKLSGTLHALSRDWSIEGSGERAESYDPLIEAVKTALPLGAKVLVPGSGLARLVCEVSGAGYKAQGNDFDLFMLFTADFMLNGLHHYSKEYPPPPSADGEELQQFEQVIVHPWVHATCNNLSHADACRPIALPDSSAASILFAASEKAQRESEVNVASSNNSGEDSAALASAIEGVPSSTSAAEVAAARDLSMCAGEFVQAYADSVGEWDGFVSCFFVDTAPNVLEFIQLVHTLLKPGAVWLNHGPLTYHFADAYSELSEPGWLDERYHESVELSWEELKHALEKGGFRIEEEVTGLPSHYTINDKSCVRTQYRCIYFKAIRL